MEPDFYLHGVPLTALAGSAPESSEISDLLIELLSELAECDSDNEQYCSTNHVQIKVDGEETSVPMFHIDCSDIPAMSRHANTLSVIPLFYHLSSLLSELGLVSGSGMLELADGASRLQDMEDSIPLNNEIQVKKIRLVSGLINSLMTKLDEEFGRIKMNGNTELSSTNSLFVLHTAINLGARLEQLSVLISGADRDASARVNAVNAMKQKNENDSIRRSEIIVLAHKEILREPGSYSSQDAVWLATSERAKIMAVSGGMNPEYGFSPRNVRKIISQQKNTRTRPSTGKS